MAKRKSNAGRDAARERAAGRAVGSAPREVGVAASWWGILRDLFSGGGDDVEPSCQHCGAELDPRFKSCPMCGTKVGEPPLGSKCVGCGEPLEPRWRFCPECHTEVRDVPIPAPRGERTERIELKDKPRGKVLGFIVVRHNQSKGPIHEYFEIADGVSWIGSAPDNDVVFYDSMLEDKHARIHAVYKEGGSHFTIQDMSKRAGMIVDNNPSTGMEQPLIHNDKVQIGDHTLILVTWGG